MGHSPSVVRKRERKLWLKRAAQAVACDNLVVAVAIIQHANRFYPE
jgi:hypothetical protein